MFNIKYDYVTLRSASVCEQRSITFAQDGRKSLIRKFNHVATESETQGAEGDRVGFLRREMLSEFKTRLAAF